MLLTFPFLKIIYVGKLSETISKYSCEAKQSFHETAILCFKFMRDGNWSSHVYQPFLLAVIRTFNPLSKLFEQWYQIVERTEYSKLLSLLSMDTFVVGKQQWFLSYLKDNIALIPCSQFTEFGGAWGVSFQFFLQGYFGLFLCNKELSWWRTVATYAFERVRWIVRALVEFVTSGLAPKARK